MPASPVTTDDEPLSLPQLAALDADLDPADLLAEDFDPDTSLPDGSEAWLADLATPARDALLDGLAPPVPEALAAGFTHHDGGRGGPRFAAGGAADLMLPGRVLAGLAADAWQAGLGQLSDDELIGVTLAARRGTSWQQALELAAVTELATRRQPPAAPASSRQHDHLTAEIAAALTLTSRSAESLLDLAAALARLPHAADLLAAGIIDRPRAQVLASELAGQDDQHAAAAAERVLPAAGQLTTSQLRAALRRALLATDPQAAIKRRRAAEKHARVDTWPETAGTAALAGRDLPPAQAIAADQRISAHARWLKHQGTPGSLDQIRARVFLALLCGQPVHDLLPQPPGQRPGTPDPGHPDRSGTPAGPGAPGSLQDGNSGPDGPERTAGVSGGWPCWPAGLSGQINLTLPLPSYLGVAASPGEITGLGPLDAAACRDLAAILSASPASRWCLTLTDRDGRAVAHGCARAGPGPPGSDPADWLAGLKICVLEAGTCSHQRQSRGYQPAAALRHLIKIRQRTCSFPGCRGPAERCDDDHTIPYDQGGRTCECNLEPLCRHHHQAKQAPGWHLRQPQPGTLTWTLPHGRTYTTTPGTYPS